MNSAHAPGAGESKTRVPRDSQVAPTHRLVPRMSVDRMMREMVASEIARALEPVHAALAEFRSHGEVVGRLASALGQPIKRGPGRPPKASAVADLGTKRRGRNSASSTRGCAVIDCSRPAHSRGYCTAHYQKFRMLDRTGRRPADWVPDAEPSTVRNIVLPRGRRAA